MLFSVSRPGRDGPQKINFFSQLLFFARFCMPAQNRGTKARHKPRRTGPPSCRETSPESQGTQGENRPAALICAPPDPAAAKFPRESRTPEPLQRRGKPTATPTAQSRRAGAERRAPGAHHSRSPRTHPRKQGTPPRAEPCRTHRAGQEKSPGHQAKTGTPRAVSRAHARARIYIYFSPPCFVCARIYKRLYIRCALLPIAARNIAIFALYCKA